MCSSFIIGIVSALYAGKPLFPSILKILLYNSKLNRWKRVTLPQTNSGSKSFFPPIFFFVIVKRSAPLFVYLHDHSIVTTGFTSRSPWMACSVPSGRSEMCYFCIALLYSYVSLSHCVFYGLICKHILSVLSLSHSRSSSLSLLWVRSSYWTLDTYRNICFF